MAAAERSQDCRSQVVEVGVVDIFDHGFI
jgi:hypothetical protein